MVSDHPQVLVAYLLAIVLALPNTYGDGLTDWDMASMYGKLSILLFAAWGGSDGGITAGLVRVTGVVPSCKQRSPNSLAVGSSAL